ncbi:MAG: hypothetical protein LC775_12035, partial [Acidobacteria bacterium]|nr:hypothetical protein [Acidobacteriota bacterium]
VTVEAILATLFGSIFGAYLGYWTNLFYQRASRPKVMKFGFLWRPGRALSRHPWDEGDLLKFWFQLGGRNSPRASSLEIVYIPPGSTLEEGDSVSVFGKWDESPNPVAEQVLSNGTVIRTFYADRVPATYFLPLRLGRVYTVPVLFGAPPMRERVANGLPESGAAATKDSLLLFSAWWFDPTRPRPDLVPEVEAEGKLRLVLAGDDLLWEREFPIGSIVRRSGVVDRAESDARQQHLSTVLSSRCQWPDPEYAVVRRILGHAALKRPVIALWSRFRYLGKKRPFKR